MSAIRDAVSSSGFHAVIEGHSCATHSPRPSSTKPAQRIAAVMLRFGGCAQDVPWQGTSGADRVTKQTNSYIPLGRPPSRCIL